MIYRRELLIRLLREVLILLAVYMQQNMQLLPCCLFLLCVTAMISVESQLSSIPILEGRRSLFMMPILEGLGLPKKAMKW